MERIELEYQIRCIFVKETLNDADVQLGTYLINKWKKLTNWVENTTPVLKHTI